jgi:hypothetical protein
VFSVFSSTVWLVPLFLGGLLPNPKKKSGQELHFPKTNGPKIGPNFIYDSDTTE